MFWKHFTRKEAHNLRTCTDSIATSDVEVMAHISVEIGMHVVSLITVLDMLKMFASLLNVDVDECTAFPNICGANTDCHNTDGSYTCICKAGYTWDGKTCSGKGLFYLKLIVFTMSETFRVH